jgi:hypothetical protein
LLLIFTSAALIIRPVPVTNVLRRAFVVMPFGEKEVPKRPMVEAAGEGKAAGDALQVDFDAVYEKLLAPALRVAGCTPFRATEEKRAGDIRKDMFLGADHRRSRPGRYFDPQR